MPIPSVLPTMTARPNPTPRMRMSPLDAERAAVWFSIAGYGRLLRLERDEHHVDGAADVARRVAAAERLELGVAAHPAVHDGPALRGVLDRTARQVHDDRVRPVRVQSLARADLHPGADHRHEIVIEDRREAHAR